MQQEGIPKNEEPGPSEDQGLYENPEARTRGPRSQDPRERIRNPRLCEFWRISYIFLLALNMFLNNLNFEF